MHKIDLLFLIDDDDIFQFMTKKMIESTGLVGKMKIFSNGKDALKYLDSAKDVPDRLPNTIFLDLFMPVMNGWVFLDEFKKIKMDLDKETTIYIVSSSIDPTDIERAQSIPEVTDFIVKPVTKSKFLDLIKRIA